MKNLSLALLALTVPVSTFANECPEINGHFKSKNENNSLIPELLISTEKAGDQTVYEVGEATILADGQNYSFNEGTISAVCSSFGTLIINQKFNDGDSYLVTIKPIGKNTIKLFLSRKANGEKARESVHILRK